jgi:lysine 2,3-aminomutase
VKSLLNIPTSLTPSQLAKNILGKPALLKFLQEVLPEKIPPSELHQGIETPDAFIEDVIEGINAAPMSIRLTPHILSCIDWEDPLNDPLRRQFIPMMSTIQPDHPKLCLDSLHEKEDSPCEGLVHRYTDKCLFLGTPISSPKSSVEHHSNIQSLRRRAPIFEVFESH